MKLVFWKGLQPAFHRTKEALYQQDHSALTDLTEGGGTAHCSTTNVPRLASNRHVCSAAVEGTKRHQALIGNLLPRRRQLRRFFASQRQLAVGWQLQVCVALQQALVPVSAHAQRIWSAEQTRRSLVFFLVLAIVLALRPAIFDCNILAINVAT